MTGKEAVTRTATGRDDFIIGVNSFHSASGRFGELRRSVNAKWEATGLQVRVCEMATGNEVWTANLGSVPTLTNASLSVVTSPDGRRFVVTCAPYIRPVDRVEGEYFVHLWFGRLADHGDIRTLQASFPLSTSQNVGIGAPTMRGMSPDGRELVLAMNSEVQTWNLRTGELTHRFARHPDSVRAVLYCDDCNRIFTLTGDSLKPTQLLHVWDTATDREVSTMPLAFPKTSEISGGDPPVTIAGLNGAKLVTHQGRQVRVLDGTPLPERKK